MVHTDIESTTFQIKPPPFLEKRISQPTWLFYGNIVLLEFIYFLDEFLDLRIQIFKWSK